MQRYGDRRPSSNNNTYALAQFLATTGPEQFKRPNYENHDSHQLIKMVPFQYNNNNNNKTNNFFDRLRKKKKPSTSSFHQTSSSSSTSTSTSSFQHHKYKHQQQQSSSSSFNNNNNNNNNNKKKHIPLIDESYLPYYLQQPPQQNNKLINKNDKENEKKLKDKEIKKEEETKLPSFPTPPPSSMHDFDEDHQHQNNPSLTTSSTTTTTTSSSLSTSTATTNHNNIKGVRHMEVQTDDIIEEDEEREDYNKDHDDPLLKRILYNNDKEKDRCNHCCRPYQQYTIEKHQRRKSSPASLSSGAKIKLGQEATVLLALIEQLKQQLAEEQQSRLLLEKTIQLQFLEKSL